MFSLTWGVGREEEGEGVGWVGVGGEVGGGVGAEVVAKGVGKGAGAGEEVCSSNTSILKNAGIYLVPPVVCI